MRSVSPSPGASSTTSSQPTSSSSAKDGSPGKAARKGSNTEPGVIFDAKLVARKDDGWDTMLERAILLWVDAVVAEKHKG